MSSRLSNNTDQIRQMARAGFLQQHGFGEWQLTALPQDASFRRYYRLSQGKRSYLLMDAPPEQEKVREFVLLDRHLITLGLKAPEILCEDCDQGFLILEDFGEGTFTRLLAEGFDESELYRLALETLIKLHQSPEAKHVDVPPYDLKVLVDEALLLPNWLYPLVHGARISPVARQDYQDIWIGIFAQLPQPAESLVLRDFHVDNLMLVEHGKKPECGLLDFQDALTGPMAYDLMSLLQDARRDLTPGLESELLTEYLERSPLLDHENFRLWYIALAAQRHAKVLGIFSRLKLRDGKPGYLTHLPRVFRLLENTFKEPWLKPLANWMENHFPARADFTND